LLKKVKINDLAMAKLRRWVNVHPDKLPPSVPPEKAAQILNVADATLSIWRCTGRQNLRYFKVSRLVNYRMVDLIEFKAKRIHGHTGEAA